MPEPPHNSPTDDFDEVRARLTLADDNPLPQFLERLASWVSDTSAIPSVAEQVLAFDEFGPALVSRVFVSALNQLLIHSDLLQEEFAEEFPGPWGRSVRFAAYSVLRALQARAPHPVWEPAREAARSWGVTRRTAEDDLHDEAPPTVLSLATSGVYHPGLRRVISYQRPYHVDVSSFFVGLFFMANGLTL